MGWTYIAGTITDVATANGTSTASDITFNVATHDALIAWYSWYGSGGASGGCSDGGSNTFQTLTELNRGSATGFVAYLLDAAANATATITATTATNREYRTLAVMQFRPESGKTVSLDGTPASNTGSGTSVTSGTLSTAGDDDVVIGVGSQDNWSNYSAHQIGGVNADYVLTQDNANQFASMWARLLTASASNTTATATEQNTVGWVAQILALRAASAGGPVWRPRVTLIL